MGAQGRQRRSTAIAREGRCETARMDVQLLQPHNAAAETDSLVWFSFSTNDDGVPITSSFVIARVKVTENIPVATDWPSRDGFARLSALAGHPPSHAVKRHSIIFFFPQSLNCREQLDGTFVSTWQICLSVMTCHATTSHSSRSRTTHTRHS